MSALAIIRNPDSVVIGSDGAGYDGVTGSLMAIVSKVAIMPECSCIFANRGVGGATSAMENALRQAAARGMPLRTFDDVLAVFPQFAEALHQEILGLPEAPTVHFSFMLGGYSEDRARFETYTIRTRPFSAPNTEGDFVEHPPFSLISLPAIHLAPHPALESAARVGITRPQEMQAGFEIDARAYAAKAIAACRLDREQDPLEGAANIHYVGGFIQVTTLAQGAVLSEIVHQWPDVIGQLLDPNNGELLPTHLKPENLDR